MLKWLEDIPLPRAPQKGIVAIERNAKRQGNQPESRQEDVAEVLEGNEGRVEGL